MRYLHRLLIHSVIVLGIISSEQKLAIAQLICSPQSQAVAPNSFRTPPSPAPPLKTTPTKSAQQIAEERGDYAAAEKLWRNEIEQSGPTGRKYYKLGETLRVQKRFGAAIAAYHKAIQLAPEAEVTNQLADLCFAWGRAAAQNAKPIERGDMLVARSGVTTCVERLLKRHPQSSKLHEQMGMLLAYQRQDDAAIRVLQRAIRLMPCDVDFFMRGRSANYLMELLIRQARWTELGQAKQFLRKRYPTHKLRILRIEAGNLYVNQHWDRAIAAYQQILKLDPTDQLAKVILQEIATQKSQKQN